MSYADKWIKQENTVLTEVIQTKVDKCCIFSLITGYKS